MTAYFLLAARSHKSSSLTLSRPKSKVNFLWLEVALFIVLAGIALMPLGSLVQEFSQISTVRPSTVQEEVVPMLPEYVFTAPRVK